MGGFGDLLSGLFGGGSATDTAEAALYAAQLQWQIANRVQSREEELFELWRTQYKGIEQDLAREFDALEPYKAETVTAQVRAVTEVRKQFSHGRLKALACMDVHCVGASIAQIRDLGFAEALAAGWAMSLAVRAEEAKKRAVDHQHRQEKLGFTQFSHQGYTSSDGEMIAATIARNLQNAASKAASDQARATAFAIDKGANILMGTGSLGKDTGNSSGQRSESPNSFETRWGGFVTNDPVQKAADDALIKEVF